MTNLLSRDVAADMQVDASGDDDGRIGLMKTEPVTIKLKAGVEPLGLTTARRVPFPLVNTLLRQNSITWLNQACSDM